MHIIQSEEKEMGKAKRKFLAEAGVHLYSGGATVLRPADLYRYGKDQRLLDALEGCNIYVVARRRRISVDPFSLRTFDGLLYGDFRVHGDDLLSFERVAFSQKCHLVGNDGMPLKFIQAETFNEKGFDVRVADDRGGVGNLPTNVLIANARHNLGKETNLEVLYVGQAFGKDGKRLAIDRLLAHTTLQRILAESAEENPYDEVLLLLFRYEHHRNIVSTAGDFSVEPSASDAEEREHLSRVGHIRLDRKSRITLAEAALINYFKPKYNIMHRNSLNTDRTKKLKFLKKVLALDLSALLVEINTSNFGSKLFSPHAPVASLQRIFAPDHVARLESLDWQRGSGLSKSEVEQFVAEMTHAHIARFPLYSATERETFLHALPWGQE